MVQALLNIYELNKESTVTIRSDHGTSNHFQIGEIFKQGTLWAAPICANFIDKGLREIKDDSMGISLGQIKIPYLLYQDDILLISVNETTMNSMLKIARDFQDKNSLRYNSDKSQYICTKFNRTKQDEVKVNLNNLPIKQTAKYKYLGNIVNEKFNLHDTINDKCNSGNKIIFEMVTLSKNPVLNANRIEIV